jgi:N-acetylglucosaminyl-diphospho-decaprenol L-rhamnosyltransferase
VTASAFRHLGGFDEKYFVYMEDVDFGRRMSNAGGAVIALDHCLVHEGSRGSQISWKARKSLLDGARLAYAAHHHGSAFAAVLRLLSRC